MARGSLFAPACAGASSHRISSFLHIAFAVFLIGLPCAQSEIQSLYLDITDLNLLVDETRLFNLIQIGEPNINLQVTSQIQHSDVVQFVPPTVEIPGSNSTNSTAKITYDICAYGKSPGHSEVTFNVTPAGTIDMDKVFVRVTVMHSNVINIISYIMGWIYFAAWSVSFYPQIYENFKRKSVVGLNFDFLALNIFGFTMYSLFNCGLYFSSEIQNEYFARHPRSHNPVQLNDVFFSLHAAFATVITIVQCIIYERDEQRVSRVAGSLLGVFTVAVIVTASLGAAKVIMWLDFLYYCSYIKLCITLIKYVPQAYMNYKRKSTEGWSIGNIFLDFIGGFLSILQMMLNAYNFNDWISFFGDATKFGLGAFSLIFDIFFLLQHYVFYRESRTVRRYTYSFDEEMGLMWDKSRDFEGREILWNKSRDFEGRDNFWNITRSFEAKEYLLVNDWHADEKTRQNAQYIVLPGTEEGVEQSPTEENNDETHNSYDADRPYQATPT